MGPFGHILPTRGPVSGQRGRNHRVEVGVDHLRAQRLARAAERHRGQRAGLLRGRRDPGVDRRDDLGAVRPVHLGAVILPGVVAGRNHQPGRGAQQADREGQDGRRDRGAERQDPQAGAGQHRGGLGRERLGAAARVETDDNRPAGEFGPSGPQVPGQAGRHPADGGPVHPARAGPQRAPDARGAERQRLGEPRRELAVVAGLQERAELGAVRRVGIVRDPRPRRGAQPDRGVMHQPMFRGPRGWPVMLAMISKSSVGPVGQALGSGRAAVEDR